VKGSPTKRGNSCRQGFLVAGGYESVEKKRGRGTEHRRDNASRKGETTDIHSIRHVGGCPTDSAMSVRVFKFKAGEHRIYPASSLP